MNSSANAPIAIPSPLSETPINPDPERDQKTHRTLNEEVRGFALVAAPTVGIRSKSWKDVTG
jgi:hypothetical protein